jgi:putative DNA primase/helicase
MRYEELTDLGNTRRLVNLHGRDLKYVAGRGWFTWDRQRWAHDQTGEVQRRAKDAVRSIYLEAAEIGDDKERSAVGGWAHASQSAGRISAMVKLAQTEPEIALHPMSLDGQPFALNTLNGTVDLRSGELRPHRREDLFSKLTGAAYEPSRKSARWDGFLRRVLPDPDVRSFVQRAGGYSATGSTAEEKLFFAYGPTATGKSTFLEAIRSALGDYAAVADFNTFTKRRSEGPRNDIASLAGARLVTSIEVDDGTQLAQGLVKTLTGGEAVTARFLYHESFTFVPTFVLWLAANHRPRADDRDSAMWRRIVEVPFRVAIPEGERDPTLKESLRNDPADREAVLAWIVEGALAWQRDGLKIPDAVRQASNEYRNAMSPLTTFLTERCTLDPQGRERSADLYAAYLAHASDQGDEGVGKGEFRDRLRALGVEPKHRRDGWWWHGVSLLSDGDDDDDDEIEQRRAMHAVKEA